MGSPVANLNAIRNGSRLEVRRLTVGSFPVQLQKVQYEGRKYRRALEDAVLETHQDVSVTHAHLIDTASAATIHAGICRWLLRQRIAEMNTGDVLACSNAMLRAKETRDRAVKQLGLDRRDTDAIDALYELPPPNVAEKAPSVPSKADSAEKG